MAGKFWREAATLMVVSRLSKTTNFRERKFQAHNDYEMLFLKRSSKSKFMPEAYVFPGGTIDASDLSSEWCHIFENCGFSIEDMRKTFRLSTTLPEIYSNKLQNKLLPEIAFRICALRETFEETGLLLRCEKSSSGNPVLNPVVIDKSLKWRDKVLSDAKNFRNLFIEHGGCPWIWGLHEWSNWLTPTDFGGMKRRFDTVFYMTFLDSLPEVCSDNHEAEIIEASDPFVMMQKWHNEELWLAPPQVYELSRIQQFRNYEELKKFSIERAHLGIEQYLPVRLATDDGWISLLPGDSMYPVNSEVEFNSATPKTMEEIRKSSVNLHRMEISGLFTCLPKINIKLKNHIGPKQEIFHENSKL